MRKSVIVLSAVIALSSANFVNASEGEPVKRAIHARKAAFTLIAANLGPMGAMVKDKIPFDKGEFILRAANLEVLSKMPWEFFIPGSQGGSEARPSVWEKADDFKAKAEIFQEKVADLVKVNKGGDEKAMRIQFAKVARTCKSCHRDYKRD